MPVPFLRCRAWSVAAQTSASLKRSARTAAADSAGIAGAILRHAERLLLQQPRLLHLAAHLGQQRLEESAGVVGVRGPALSGPDQLVLLEAVDQRLDLQDPLRLHVAGVDEAPADPPVASVEVRVAGGGVVRGGRAAHLL